MKIVFSGNRNFNNYNFVKNQLDNLLKHKNIEILVGDCKGIDSLIVRYAKENDIKYQIFKANWDKYGKSAGPKRNKQMIDKGSGLIAFWDQKSRGTKSTIDFAKQKGIKIMIINLEEKV